MAQRGGMGGGDGADDGQAEPVPLADPLPAQSLERLEQPLELIRHC